MTKTISDDQLEKWEKRFIDDGWEENGVGIKLIQSLRAERAARKELEGALDTLDDLLEGAIYIVRDALAESKEILGE